MYLVGWGLRTNLKFKDIMVTCTSAETNIWHKATEGDHKVGINNWGSGKIYIYRYSQLRRKRKGKSTRENVFLVNGRKGKARVNNGKKGSLNRVTI